MVDRKTSGTFSKKQLSRPSSSSSTSDFDEDYRLQLEGTYLGNGLGIRPPSGTNHQQPGSHLSIDTRLSELSLGSVDDYNEVNNAIFCEARSLQSSNSSRNLKRVQVKKPNCYITSPFKQGYHIPKKGPVKEHVVDPSYDLKNVTRESIAKVRKQFRRPRPPSQPPQYSQRLRKSKLKTTGRPMSGSGPSIKQCKGIQSGVRVIHSSGQPGIHLNESYSRMGSSSLRPESPTELLRPESSIHCTSRVSSIKAGSQEDSPSEESFDNYAIDSWIDYSDFERVNPLSHSDDQARDQDIINLETDINRDQKDQTLSKESHRSVRKIELEIPRHDLFSDVGVLAQENERSNSNGEENLFTENDEFIAGTNFKNLQLKKSNPIANDKESFRKERKSDEKGTCKPFRDAEDAEADDDDDDKDDQRRLAMLLTSYHSNRAKLECKQDVTSGSKLNGKSGDESKTSEYKQRSCNNGISNNMEPSVDGTRFDSFNGNKASKIEKGAQNEGVTPGVTKSCAKNDSPIIAVHVKRTTEKKENSKIESASSRAQNESKELNEMTWGGDFDDLIPYDDDDDEIDDLIADDLDDLDTDRIPSAEIWKNLDQLNLSMDTHHNALKTKNDLEFPLKTRKVQSAGSQRKTINPSSYAQYSNLYKTKQHSRTSLVKRKKKKDSKPSEMIDKAELLRRFFTEESRKHSADLRSKLPGYFSEQFSIIEQEKRNTMNDGLPTEANDVQSLLEKDLVKFEEGKRESPCNEEENTKGEFSDKEKKRELLLDSILGECESFEKNKVGPPCSDPPSSGVFFTVETSSCEIESTSGRTVETMGENECREFSDDTGFETMPGNAGVHDRNNPHENVSDDEKSPFKFNEYRQDEVKVCNRDNLEIIAKAKHLTDPSFLNKKHLPSPHEPLKFYINAKPPAGYLFYFAYGADMNIKRMSFYLRREHKRLWGVLFGFRLCFNKKGSSTDAGGFANVEFCPGSSVEGCVYLLTDAELFMLDNCIGYPKHYTRAVLPVWMCNSHQPSLHGVAQYCVPAVLYVAEQQWVQSDYSEALDNNYSVSQCLKAADILTPNYVEYLNQLGTSNCEK